MNEQEKKNRIVQKVKGKEFTLTELDKYLLKNGFKSNKEDPVEHVKDFVKQEGMQWWLDGEEYDKEPYDFTFYFAVLEGKENVWETKIKVTRVYAELLSD